MPRRPRRDRITVEEAQRIAAHAEAGRLETRDERIAREVAEANRRLVRSALWGRNAAERHRTAATIGLLLAGIVVFAGGLAAALLFH